MSDILYVTDWAKHQRNVIRDLFDGAECDCMCHSQGRNYFRLELTNHRNMGVRETWHFIKKA